MAFTALLFLAVMLAPCNGKYLNKRAEELSDSLKNYPELLEEDNLGESLLKEIEENAENNRCPEPECRNADDLDLWVSQIYDGVTEVPMYKKHGHLMVFGAKTFPLLIVNDVTILAGAELGEGRVFAASHKSYISHILETYVKRSTEEASGPLECLTDEDGESYNGTKSTTVSGRTCQAWGSQNPHSHYTGNSADELPDATLEDAANYCRNPDNEPGPWCYTTDKDKRFELCDIPYCADTVHEGVIKMRTNIKKWVSKGAYEDDSNVCVLKSADDMGCLSDDNTKLVAWYGGDWPTEEQEQQLLDYVKNGGGLLYGLTPYNWRFKTTSGKAGKTFDNIGFYSVVVEAGIAYKGWHYSYDEEVSPPTSEEAVDQLKKTNWVIAVSQMKTKEDVHEVYKGVIDEWKSYINHKSAMYPLLQKKYSQPFVKLAERFENDMPWPQGSIEDPDNEIAVTKADQTLFRVYGGMDYAEAWKDKGPTVDKFPGDVDDNVTTETFEGVFSGSKYKYHSTGMWLPAGKEMLIEILNDDDDYKEFKIVIGCHFDMLFKKKELNRFPIIRRYVHLNKKVLKVKTKYGGCVWAKQNDEDEVVTLKLRLTGVIKMAYLNVNNDESKAEWETRKNSAAPWGVIESEWMMFTLPNEAMKAKTLPEIEEAMNSWDQVVISDYDLKKAPPKETRQMFVGPDIQISYGWMHSGYPIGTHLDKATPSKKRFVLSKAGFNYQWGLYHEVGHNMQDWYWTYSGTGEVTTNIFSLYQFWKIDNDKYNVLKQLDDTIYGSTFNKYLANPTFDNCFDSAWCPLLPYAQFAEHFGFGCYSKVFETYWDDHDTIQTNQDEKNEWVKRSSRAVGYNLCPLWDFYSLHISESVRTGLQDLKPFLPDDIITQKPEAASMVANLKEKYGADKLMSSVDNPPACSTAAEKRGKSVEIEDLMKKLEALF